MRWTGGEAVRRAGRLAELLDRGGFLVVPTESSYALAADPTNAKGVAAVFALKGRPPDRPLPLVGAAREQLEAVGADFGDATAQRLADRWPAALTLVVPTRRALPATAGRSTVAVRVPAHAGLRGLLTAVGRPLTATSANRSGDEPWLDPDEIERAVAGSDACLVDEGKLAGGPPSTIVLPGASGFEVLRPGSYPVAALEAEFSATSVEIPEDRGRRASVPTRG